MNQLPQWRPVNNFQVNPHQAIVDNLNAVGQLFPDDSLEVYGTPTGKLINTTVRSHAIIWESPGIVMLNGPSDEVPQKLEQYWVQLAFAIPRDITQTLASTRIRYYPEGGSDHASGQAVIATNLAEMPLFAYNEPIASGSGSGVGSGSSFTRSGYHSMFPGQQVKITATALRLPQTTAIIYTFSSSPRPMPVALGTKTIVSARTQFEWKEQRLVKQGTFEDKPNGLTNATFTPPAYVWPTGDASAEESDIVYVFGWTNNTGAFELIIVGSAGAGLPPAGQQETVLKAVVDNTWGVDFIKTHK